MPFVDAKSNFNSESDLTNEHPMVDSSETTTSSASQMNKLRDLPDWNPKPGDLPENWSVQSLLERNPNCDPKSNEPIADTSVEGWHAVLNPDWVRIVSNDLHSMATNPVNSTDSDSRPVCFSDGYISGMPPKRRKVSL